MSENVAVIEIGGHLMQCHAAVNGMLGIRDEAMQRMRTPVVRQQRRMKIKPTLGKEAEQLLWDQGRESVADQYVRSDIRQLSAKLVPVVRPAEFDQLHRCVAEMAHEQKPAPQPAPKIANAEASGRALKARHDNRAYTVARFYPAGKQRPGVSRNVQYENRIELPSMGRRLGRNHLPKVWRSNTSHAAAPAIQAPSEIRPGKTKRPAEPSARFGREQCCRGNTREPFPLHQNRLFVGLPHAHPP
nr:hypothetical protein [Mesorhizobium sp. ES1-4]